MAVMLWEFFRVSMPEAHSWTCRPGLSVSGVLTMTKYEYLLSKKESGELSILFELGLPVHLSGWMEYYAFHLTHPEMSNVEISYYFTATKSTIQRAIAFMESPIG